MKTPHPHSPRQVDEWLAWRKAEEQRASLRRALLDGALVVALLTIACLIVWLWP